MRIVQSASWCAIHGLSDFLAVLQCRLDHELNLTYLRPSGEVRIRRFFFSHCITLAYWKLQMVECVNSQFYEVTRLAFAFLGSGS